MSNIHESVYLAPGSVVLRDVTMAKDSSVWFNTVHSGQCGGPRRPGLSG